MAGTTARFDLLALGNAIVDVIAQTPEDFLATHGLTKGAMALIGEEPAQALLAAMGETQTVSGGSAANTAIGAASFGCRASFMGRVRDDHLGARFIDDIRKAGVHFPVDPATSGPSTARCFVLVTPDGQRTMNTFLGACQDLTAADVDPEIVRAAEIVYLEGYLWDPPAAKEAFRKAAAIAHSANRKVALSLSDAFCVGRYRSEFLELIAGDIVDVLFANERELLSLYEETDFEQAVAHLPTTGLVAAVTRSEKGCIVVGEGRRTEVPAAPIRALVDTTGAGDLFAAGFIAGLVRQHDLEDCARLGALAAGEIIQHIGARPQTDLRALAAANGLTI